MNATPSKDMTLADKPGALLQGDLCRETLDGKTVRYIRSERDGWVAVADLDDGHELPDLRHPSQIILPHWRIA